MEAITLLKNKVALDSIYQSVLNKKVSLPANEIITKEYAIDVKPFVKLMTKQQLQKSQKNINYVPPKIKNQQFEAYGQKFHPIDFLGYKYVEEFDQMVYFRYNNEQFNELRQGNSDKGTKYFAGLFIPLRALQSKQFKVEDNLYNALNLTVPQLKDSVSQSFSKNCKGCSFDPLFSSNFTSGNLMAAIRKKPFEYDIILQNDTNSKGAEWFNFAVKFIQEGTYTFNIVNLSNENPMYEMGMKIPHFSFHQQSLKNDGFDSIKSGNGWSFGGKNVVVTKTDLRKQNQLFDQSYYSLSFQFKCKNRQQIAVFASSIPYTSLDYERFLNRVLFNRIGQHMKMEKIEICQSLAGSSLSAYIFYHRKSKSNTLLFKNLSEDKLLSQNFRSNERQRTLNLNNSQSSSSFVMQNPTFETSTNQSKSIVFLARQHSGETPSSFVLEGVIEFLMDNTEFDVFKKNFRFIIIPFVNVDGVKYGNQKVNLAGADLNKVWKNPNETFEPQVFHIKNFLKRVHQVHPISLMINLSSNNHKLSSHFTSASSKKYCEQAPELFPYICSKRVPQISFQRSEFLPIYKQSFVCNLSQTFPKSLVYDFSTSYYGWKTQNAGFRRYTESSCASDEDPSIFEFTPDIYRNVGREIITTYLQYARLCEKNIGIRDRWLRQIEQLPSPSLQNKQINIYEKKYEQTWDRELIHFDYSLYCSPDELKYQKSQGRRHKTSLPYRFSGSQLNEVRSKPKKLTMPNIKNSRYSKQQKPNTLVDSQQTKVSQEQQGSIDSSVDSLLEQFKKSPLSSSIFTPKRRTQILKEISESIKQSSLDKQNSFTDQPNTLPPTNILKMIDKKEKRISKLMFEQKNQILVPKTLILKQEDNKTKIQDAIAKFQNMKKFISTMGIRAQAKTGVNDRA